MRPVVLDTCIWVEWLRKAQPELKDRLNNRVIYIPAIVELELLSGVGDKKSERIVETLLKPFRRNRRVVVPSAEDYRLGGQILAELKLPASKMSNDMMIAVSAKKLGAEVWSLNEKDFTDMCKILAVPLLAKKELDM